MEACAFEGNSGGGAGAVDLATRSRVIVQRSRFAANTGGAGAVRVQAAGLSPREVYIGDSAFENNAGGCVVVGSAADPVAAAVSIVRTTFRRCSVAASAWEVTGSALLATLTGAGRVATFDSLFEGNVATGEATSGGTVAVIGPAGLGATSATFTRCTFAGNAVGVAAAAGAGVVGACVARALSPTQTCVRAPCLFCGRGPRRRWARARLAAPASKRRVSPAPRAHA